MNAFQIEKHLVELKRLAKENHVRLDIHASHAKEIYIDLIVRRSSSEKGSGSLVMQSVCDFADSHRLDLRLHTITLSEKLLDFYGKFGFEPSGQVGSKNCAVYFFRRPPNAPRPESTQTHFYAEIK